MDSYGFLCVPEAWHAASVAFANGPMLTMAAIDALKSKKTRAIQFKFRSGRQPC
jgi:hypothetical protein